MTFLIIAIGLFIFAWSRHRKTVQARKAQRYDSYLDTYPRYNRNTVSPPVPYSPPTTNITNSKSDVIADVALGVGAALAGEAIYEAIRHEESNDNSSSNSNDYDLGSFNNSSDDYDSSTGFDGGDSCGGGSDGDW